MNRQFGCSVLRELKPIGAQQKRKPTNLVSAFSVRFSVQTELPPNSYMAASSSQDLTHTQHRSDAERICMSHKLMNSQFPRSESNKNLTIHNSQATTPASKLISRSHLKDFPGLDMKPDSQRGCCRTSTLARGRGYPIRSLGFGSPRRRPVAACG